MFISIKGMIISILLFTGLLRNKYNEYGEILYNNKKLKKCSVVVIGSILN